MIDFSNVHSNMYHNWETWNPFKGCEYECNYCIHSFQRQAKRQKHRCTACYEYRPHFHAERLNKLPSSNNIFACGNGDIAFCPEDQLEQIVAVIRKRADRTFLLQSKDPSTFARIMDIPDNLILGTTIETDREDIYQGISKAPVPAKRIESFAKIDHHRKMLTIEPIMVFTHDVMVQWVKDIDPELVWLGFETKKTPGIQSPTVSDAMKLCETLEAFGYTVKMKYIPKEVAIA